MPRSRVHADPRSRARLRVAALRRVDCSAGENKRSAVAMDQDAAAAGVVNKKAEAQVAALSETPQTLVALPPGVQTLTSSRLPPAGGTKAVLKGPQPWKTLSG